MRAALVAPIALVLVLAGCTSEVTPPPPVPAAPQILAFKTSAAVVKPGETVKLSWQTRDAESVELADTENGVVSGADQKNGEVEVSIPSDRLFVLTAKNARGVRDTAAVAVQVENSDGRVLFVASPQKVTAGEPVVLAWSAPDAETIALTSPDGAAVDLGGQTTSGTVVVRPTRSGAWTLAVNGTTHEAAIEVGPSIDAVTLAPSPVKPGDTLTLSWKTTGATKVIVSGAHRGMLYEESSPAKVADGTFSEVLAEDVDPAGIVSFEVRAEAADGTFTTEIVSAYVAGAPAVREWKVPNFARKNDTFTVAWETTGADVVEIVSDGAILYRSPTRAQAAAGSVALNTPAQDTQYTLRALDARGTAAVSDAKTVEPVGIPSLVTFTASPQPGIQNGGDPVTLTWEVSEARQVTITATGQYVVHVVDGKAAQTGSIEVYPNKDTQYVIEAENGIGDAIAPATAEVTVATPAKFNFSPPSAPIGTQVTITSSTVAQGGDVIGLPTVSHNTPGEAFVDIATTGVDINYSGPDTTAKLVTLPEVFTTRLFGQVVSGDKITININGWFRFHTSSQSGYDTPKPFPTTELEPFAIAPFWSDLYDTSAGEIFYQLDTVGPDRRLIVQWNDVEHDAVTGSIVTVQAQVYSSGKVVFAYKTLQGAQSVAASIGIVNGTETSAVFPAQFPQEGDTFTFFGRTPLPATMIADPAPFTARQLIGTNGAFIEIESTYPVIPPGQFTLSEINYNPATGKSEWFEVTNHTNQAIDLKDWSIDFGNGSVFTIPTSLVLQPNGQLLFGQDADAAEASAGGPAVDLVYGNSFSMPDAAGALSLSIAGGTYTTSTWSSAGTQGASLVFDPPNPGLLYASGVTFLSCSGEGVYGASGQVGTPGAPNNKCFPWAMSSVPGAFQSILATGTPITGMLSTGNNSIRSITRQLDFTTLGGRAIKVGKGTYGTTANPISVCSNGWAALVQTTSTSSFQTTPSTSHPNGTLGVFIDDHAANATDSGVYWQQFDPDAVAASGDEYTLISWENWKRYSTSITSSLNFQIKVYESTGDVEFHYGNMTSSNGTYSDGSDATVWVEALDGQSALKVGVNEAVIQPNSGIRFTAQ